MNLPKGPQYSRARLYLTTTFGPTGALNLEKVAISRTHSYFIKTMNSWSLRHRTSLRQARTKLRALAKANIQMKFLDIKLATTMNEMAAMVILERKFGFLMEADYM